MKFQMRHTSTYGTFEVYDATTGSIHYRGPMEAAMRELSRLNREAQPAPQTSARKAARLRQQAERKQAGQR